MEYKIGIETPTTSKRYSFVIIILDHGNAGLLQK